MFVLNSGPRNSYLPTDWIMDPSSKLLTRRLDFFTSFASTKTLLLDLYLCLSLLLFLIFPDTDDTQHNCHVVISLYFL